MSIDWSRLGQQGFDRVVEGLVQRRFSGARAVNGRGGDQGIDILIERDARLEILQLKYFPEGFSGGFKAVRRSQIRESFVAAQQHQPDRWTLVVPSVITESEHKFVTELGNEDDVPVITVVDRDELDSWLADDQPYDAFLQRDPTTLLADYAMTFQQETAALLGGADDIASRVAALGGAADTLDPDWNVDFAREATGVVVSVRPAHPKAAERSPIRIAVEVNDFNDGDDEWRAKMEEAFGFGPSDPIRIPSAAIDVIRVEGPAIIAGERRASDIVLRPSVAASPGIGKPAELRIYVEDVGTPVVSWVGTVTNAPAGALGGTIEADFCGGRLQARFLIPMVDASVIAAHGLEPGIQIGFDTANALPSVVREVLALTRQVRTATKVELFLDGSFATSLMATSSSPIEDYDEDFLVIEQLADDLDIVQRKLGSYFNMPDEVSTIERINVRVARILLEGGIVASPQAQIYTLVLDGPDSPELRGLISGPRQLVHESRDPMVLPLADRELNLGPVYVIHPEATPTNSAAALAALSTGSLTDFHLTMRPGADRFFYLALADRPIEELYDQPFYGWGLSGVPDAELPDPGDAADMESSE